MKVLLDEGVPWPLRSLLAPHEGITVNYLGLSGIRNGALMRRAVELGFEGVVTLDGGFADQRPREAASLAIVVLRIGDNRRGRLMEHAGLIKAALDSVGPGQVVRVEQP